MDTGGDDIGSSLGLRGLRTDVASGNKVGTTHRSVCETAGAMRRKTLT